MTDLNALRASLVVTKHVPVAGADGFHVSGLSLESMLRVFRRHTDQLRDLFDKIVSGQGDLHSVVEQAAWAAGTLLETLPHVAAELIAEAAGHVSPEAAAVFRSIAAPVQLDALEKIAGLTFTSEMPPKKVIETVARMLGGAKSALVADPSH